MSSRFSSMTRTASAPSLAAMTIGAVHKLSAAGKAEVFLGPPAHAAGGGVGGKHRAVGSRDHDGVDATFVQCAVALLTFPQRFLGQLALPSLGELFQRSPHHGANTTQVILQHVVGRAPLERLDQSVFADRAGHENKRHVRLSLADESQRRQAIIAGYRIVTQDHIIAFLLQPGRKHLSRIDPVHNAADMIILERQAYELGGVGMVFQIQDAKVSVYFGGSFPDRVPFAVYRGFGGCAFRTAQNRPRLLIASMSSRKAIGLTTRASTPFS